MASRGVSVLKFVGTVSLGLLTGLSYTLSSLTVPTLIALPSASTAAKTLKTLNASAKTHLAALASISSSAFLLAFFLSPRSVRHPYLLYTSFLVLSSRLAVSAPIAPYLFAAQPSKASSSSSSTSQKRKEPRGGPRRMDQSYELLGSDAQSEGTDSASDKDLADAEEEHPMNGEEIRSDVDSFLKKQLASTTLSGLGFLIAVVGIWGDGVTSYVNETFVNIAGY